MKNPSRNVSYSQLALQKKLEVMRAFQSAKSVDKKIKAFEKVEKLFSESELGVECWTLAVNLLYEGRSREQVISFGRRALNIFISNDNTDDIPFMGNFRTGLAVGTGKDGNGNQCDRSHNSSFYIACVCDLLATACHELKRYDEGLSYLNWANRNLTKLLEDDTTSCVGNCVSHTLVGTQVQLFNVKVDMGKWEDVVVHGKKALEIMEKIMVEGCIEIGQAYKRLLVAYLVLMDYKEALPCCLKAVEIHTKHFGSSSVEVANMMRQLATIYSQLGEREKALEQNQLAQSILKNKTPEFLKGENETGCILIGMGRYEEAIDVLKRVVSHTDTEGNTRGLAFINMATALFHLGKRAEAKKHIRTAQFIFENKKMLPINVANGFECMSRLYEKMNDFKKARTLLTRALSIPEISPKLLAKGSARLFSLISLSDKEKEGIPYMEDVVEKLKEKYGAKHCEVGYGYRNLGAAYLKSGQEELAVEFMVKAKNILDAALGPHHLDSLKTSQTLAETYATLKSYNLAIEIQEKVAEGFKGRGQSEQDKLDKAVSLLRKMEVATGADSEDFPVENSKCGVSEDGTVI